MWVHGVAVVMRMWIEVVVLCDRKVGCWRWKRVGAMIDDGES